MEDLRKFPEGIMEIAKYMDYVPEVPGDPEQTMQNRFNVFFGFVAHCIMEQG